MDPRTLPALLLTVTLSAHPGEGLVRDRKGNVFCTDLKQVWRIAPDGSLWILEGSTLNAVRVRRTGPDGAVRTWP